jgi:hypothetical protein
MEHQTDTASTASAGHDGAAQAAEAAGFGDRIRERARVVKTQLDAAEAKARQRWAESKERLAGSRAGQRVQEVPVKLRTALHQAVGKVRDGLDLPSRRDISELAQRIDDLDRKLGEYEVQATARKKKKNEQGDWA